MIKKQFAGTSDLLAVLAVVVTTVLLLPLHQALSLSNTLMIFLLIVFLLAIKLGRRPSVIAAFLSVLSFAHFFVPPYFSLMIVDGQSILTLVLMLPIALITAHLTSGLQEQLQMARDREQHIQALYGLASELTGILTSEQIAPTCCRFIATNCDVTGTILLPTTDGHLYPAIPDDQKYPLAMAQKIFATGDDSWKDTDTHTSGTTLAIPLKGTRSVYGVLLLVPNGPDWTMTAAQRDFLEACATLVGLALERVHYAAVAQHTQLDVEAERLRNALLSSLSHDLRTPLTAMVSLADAMELNLSSLSGKCCNTDLIGGMRQQAHEMLADIDKLLDMARLQTGQTVLRKDWYPLEEIIGSALHRSGPILIQHKVHIDMPDDLPFVEMDAMMMERVFCNLLENAAKYTMPSSRIDIHVRQLNYDLVIVFCDDGPGLPHGQEENLFNKFVHGNARAGAGGVGLGLSIVRIIIEAHGGQVRAENQPGGGALFRLTLPLGTPPSVPIEDVEDAAE
ncbi:MAG: DUF4118 domain-containing protein [Magnetococcales bacterium]|nr:DUF4118 domain-containing protein [Magnetococcales bacterium]